MAVSADMRQQVREYLEAKCNEDGGIYQPESADSVAAELGLSKEEFLEARSSLLAANELYVTRGRNTKYSLSPFPVAEGKAETNVRGAIDIESLSTLKDLLDKVDIGQLVKEYTRLKALEESFGKPSIIRSGNTVIKTYTIVEQQ